MCGIKANTEDYYIVYTWPDSQNLKGLDGFSENCFLVSDEVGLSAFGPEAYFVNVQWLKLINKNKWKK